MSSSKEETPVSEDESGGGFGWGFVLGALAGLVAGAYFASGPGREQVDSLRTRTIELTGRRGAVNPEHPVQKAIQDGVQAAKQRRAELEAEAGEATST
jgi:hypothetical protein